jgi:hypothetical protein
MQVTKKGNAFLIYDLPSLNVEPHPHQIPSQYKEFKDMFKKEECKHLAQASTMRLHH